MTSDWDERWYDKDSSDAGRYSESKWVKCNYTILHLYQTLSCNPKMMACFRSTIQTSLFATIVFAIDAFYPASSFKMMIIEAENVVFCCSILHKL